MKAGVFRLLLANCVENSKTSSSRISAEVLFVENALENSRVALPARPHGEIQ
jgi:hypothetical protein